MVGIELGRVGVTRRAYSLAFRLRGGFTIPPWPRFPRPPYNAGRPNFSGPVWSLGISSVGLPIRREVQARVRIRPDREWFAHRLVPSHTYGSGRLCVRPPR